MLGIDAVKMRYAETSDVDIVSSFVTWESKDGLRYRFNQKQTRNGEVDQEIREARLDGPGKGRGGRVYEAEPQTLKLETRRHVSERAHDFIVEIPPMPGRILSPA